MSIKRAREATKNARKEPDYEKNIRKKQETNEKYWKGEQAEQMLQSDVTERSLTDNILYEALETFLPQATQQNPEPVVTADNTDAGNELSEKVRGMLVHLSDTLRVRLKIKAATRNWALYYLGIVKMSWDNAEDDIAMSVIRPQKMILDPDATITEGGMYTGSYIGEVKKDTAANLADKFPNAKSHIREVVQGKMGTQVQYTEWWADYGEIVFWTLKNEVLAKARNPHWNYEEETTEVDEFGNETPVTRQARNHFKTPQFPYAFLSVFNLGLHPHDDTNLVEQNLSLQDLINKRQRQIDRNVDDMNGGWAISGQRAGLTKAQAGKAIEAFRKGWGVWIPQGDVRGAVDRITGTGLPADVFNQLQDARNELRNIFGVRGTTAQGVASQETVRGKILSKQQDESRVGGGVAEYIEQFADRIFNLMVQMIMVYYDQPRVGSIIGQASAVEYIQLASQDIDRRLVVSVKEGSMIPKDPLTKRNEAIDLWSAQAIDPITLHSRLDMPNPRESAKQMFLWNAQPQALFPELGQQQQQQQQQQEAQGQQGGGQAKPKDAEQAGANNLLQSVPVQ